MGHDAGVHRTEGGGNGGVGNGTGAMEADAAGAGPGFEGGLQGPFPDEDEDNGGELGNGKRIDEEIETMPIHEPAGETKDEGGRGAGEGRRLKAEG